jgi:1,2-diacylglycerol 3-alpha-glucosyltransferase
LPEQFFLYSGRLSPEKNLETLVRAYNRYRQRSGAWGLVLAGTGSQRPSLERLAAGSEGLRFAGPQSYDDLPTFYGLAGCLILPSTRDTWGLVVNEAMASGLPVIVSNRCGCADDLVEHEGNGFLFDPSREDELTGYMLRLSAMTEEERVAMGRRSKEIIRNYSLETWAAEVTRIAGD